MKVLGFIVVLLSAVAALPDGAPICDIGSANPGNKHLTASRKPTGTSIPGGGYKVTINGVALTARDPDNQETFRNLFQFGQQLDVVVSVDTASPNPAPFLKGVLMIISNGNSLNRLEFDTKTPGALVPIPPATEEGIGCENFPLASISHTEPSEKQSITGKIFWPVAGQVLYLDVNAVTNNNSTAGSQFSYSQYILLSANIPPPARCGFLRRLLRRCS